MDVERKPATPDVIAMCPHISDNFTMKKFASALLSIFLVSASFPYAIAATTPKAGQACKKVGQKQIVGKVTLVCTNKDGKKIWVKAAVAAPSPKPSQSEASAPTPTPTVTPAAFIPMQPWATEFSRDLLVKSAVFAMNSKKNSSSSTPYEITYQDGIFPEDKASIEKLLNETFALFGASNTAKVQVLVGYSDEWAVQAAKSKSLFLITPQFPCGADHPNWDAACAEPGQAIIILNQSYKTRSSGSTPLRLGEQSFAPHETFHTYQAALAGRMSGLPPSDPMFIPRWLTEGSANFIGYYMQERVGIRPYEEGRTFQIDNNNAYFDSRGLLPLKEYSAPFMSTVYLDPYGIGQAASEYLVASAGADVLLKIFEFTGSEKSFEAGFKKATGISLEDFYTKFEIVRKHMKIGNR